MADQPQIPVLKAVRRTFWNIMSFFVMLFVPAGTLHWWRAWVFMACVIVGAIGAIALLWRDHKALIRERLKPIIQKGQPRIDRILLVSFIVAFICFELAIPLDVFHFHLLPKPPIVLSSLGLAAFIIGWCIVYFAFRDNAFAAPVVRHLEERNQTVVDQGVYRFVRHPMYAGLILSMLGMPLWLESYFALLVALIPCMILISRISVEERFLVSNLEGYENYRSRVPQRLIPNIW